MNIKKNARRKAISPVLATVILIAITLIAAVAIAGFVFGLFGTFTSTAQVSVSSVTCGVNPEVANPTCTFTLSNTGTSSAKILSSTISYQGSTGTGAAPSTPTIGAGATVTGDTIAFTDATVPVSGTQFVGTLSLSNGGVVQFTGVFV